MDQRCPRKLKIYPDTWCPLAVMRLRAIRTAGKELSEEEENNLPGCPWAVDSQSACYCFFKLAYDKLGPEETLSEIEIAALLNISVDTVRNIEKKAKNKLKLNKTIKESR